MMSLTGGVITVICDQFPNWARWLVTLVVCTGGLLLGLMYVTEGGTFMLDLVDNYGSSMIVYWTVILECTAVCYGYGLTNICNDIQFMTNRSTGIYGRFCWAIVIPLGLLENMIYFLVTADTFKSGNIEYPIHATGKRTNIKRFGIVCIISKVYVAALGWTLTGLALLLIPGFGLYAVLTQKESKFYEVLLILPKLP